MAVTPVLGLLPSYLKYKSSRVFEGCRWLGDFRGLMDSRDSSLFSLGPDLLQNLSTMK